MDIMVGWVEEECCGEAATILVDRTAPAPTKGVAITVQDFGLISFALTNADATSPALTLDPEHTSPSLRPLFETDATYQLPLNYDLITGRELRLLCNGILTTFPLLVIQTVKDFDRVYS